MNCVVCSKAAYVTMPMRMMSKGVATRSGPKGGAGGKLFVLEAVEPVRRAMTVSTSPSVVTSYGTGEMIWTLLKTSPWTC